MRKKRLDSVEEVLTAAAELFSRKGYRATTMNDIAARLSVSKPTLYAGFDGKESLLSAIIESWTDFADRALDEALAADGTARDKLAALIRGWSINAVSRRAFYMTFLADERELPTDVVDRYRRSSRRSLRRVRDCVRDGQAQGVFRSDIDALVIALSIISFVSTIPSWFRPEGNLSIGRIITDHMALFETGALVATDGRADKEDAADA